MILSHKPFWIYIIKQSILFCHLFVPPATYGKVIKHQITLVVRKRIP